MRYFKVFLKKEVLENTRNYKGFIIIIIFLFLGIISPITAKYTPEIIKSVQLEGMEMKIPIPTWIDSWGQFYKNISQIGLVVTIAIFLGIMSKEYQNNTIVNLVTKGVSREAIIISKYTSMVLLYTVAFLVAILANIIYTKVYFDKIISQKVVITLLLIYLFYIFLLGLIMFVSTISKRESNSILYILVFFIPLFIIRIIPNTNKYNPLTLFLNSTDILIGKLSLNDILPAIITTIIGLIVTLIGSIYVFNRKEI